jgi:predicted  nucleic acid-binding Zn-ribbon protein
MTIKSEKHYTLESEVKILQANVRELQSQLGAAHKRIVELGNDQNEELVKTKQLLQELTYELNTTRIAQELAVQKLQDNIPDVMDSKQVLKEGD